jgi:uncharacterized protein YkwD
MHCRTTPSCTWQHWIRLDTEREKELTHFQTNRRKKTLKERLDYYGFPFTAAAENLARGYVLVPIYATGSRTKTIVVETYEQQHIRRLTDGFTARGIIPI